MSLVKGSKDENHHLPKENNSISHCMMVSGRKGRLLGSLATSQKRDGKSNKEGNLI